MFQEGKHRHHLEDPCGRDVLWMHAIDILTCHEACPSCFRLPISTGAMQTSYCLLTPDLIMPNR